MSDINRSHLPVLPSHRSSTEQARRTQQPPDQYSFPSHPSPTSSMPGVPSPHLSSTARARRTQHPPAQYSVPSYSSSTSPISGVPSPHFLGHAHQGIPQQTQQFTPMSPPSYEQSRYTMQQQTGQYNTMSRSLHPADNIVFRSTPQSSSASPDNLPTASGRPNHHHRSLTMTSPQSRRLGQTDFPGSSASAHLGDRNFASPSGTHIANLRNGNTATRPFAAGPSSHASMSIEANGSMAASAQSFPIYQSNDAMVDTPARPKFSTAESMPFTRNGDIPEVPQNAPSSRNTYTRPSSNMNQYTGYSSHNPPSLHSSQYRNTVPRNILLPSGSLQVPSVPQHLSPNADLAPPDSYPQLFTHDFGTQCGSQSAGPPYQPLPSMAHSPSTHPQDSHRRNVDSHANSGGYRETRAQDTNPSSPTAFFCHWVDENNGHCSFHGSLDDLKKHFRSHLSGAQNALSRCRWKDCQNRNDIRRDSTWRHVRETHLKIKRGT